ncbi:hypothetical protein Mgra_00005751 [Meloidogyne graminicola]|uniref:Uncharacterized protein n=1 Tax=Meloidogyne graminicola TaxID=189291 RepID=A0A8S9ZN57_9BILA|nr:hypothetical protein Mgra_00005751 [Meloidogyne graminicola]
MDGPLSEIFSSSSKSNEDKSGSREGPSDKGTSGEGPSEIPAEVPPVHPLNFNYSIEQLEPGTNTWIEACQIIKRII